MASFSLVALLVVLASLSQAIVLPDDVVDYDVPVHCRFLYYRQRLDHFNAKNHDEFNERYVVCADSYRAGGPIFFYAGNEGDITMFVNNTQFMFDIAPEFGALVVFAEHRYYGKSRPSPHQDGPPKFNYLNTMQVLADYNALAIELRRTVRGATDSPVIAFGGSYGGMLAAWLRMKYPSTFDGALAASAPIWGFQGLSSCEYFSRIATRTFEKASMQCRQHIRHSWDWIDSLAKNKAGRDQIMHELQLCGVWGHDVVAETLKSWLASAWGYLAMVDYPTPANFLTPMPGWPVNVACSFLNKTLSDAQLLPALHDAVNVYYNYTGLSGQCFNISSPTTMGNLADSMEQWNFQACSELVMPSCSDGVNDMFEAQPWNFQAFNRSCVDAMNVQSELYFVVSEYGGKRLSSFSNIFFSNGELDPWSGGGVSRNFSDSIVSIMIKDAAHHLDLRGASDSDPPSVIAARLQEKAAIRRWIVERDQTRPRHHRHRRS